MAPTQEPGRPVAQAATVAIPQPELRFRFSRSGGPGGQNINARDTRVEVIFDVAGSASLGPRQRERAMRNLEGRLDSEGRLHVVASGERTQGRNRQDAVDRLSEVLAHALRADPVPRRPIKPSAAARRRRLEGKRARGRLKRLRSCLPDD